MNFSKFLRIYIFYRTPLVATSNNKDNDVDQDNEDQCVKKIKKKWKKKKWKFASHVQKGATE